MVVSVFEDESNTNWVYRIVEARHVVGSRVTTKRLRFHAKFRERNRLGEVGLDRDITIRKLLGDTGHDGVHVQHPQISALRIEAVTRCLGSPYIPLMLDYSSRHDLTTYDMNLLGTYCGIAENVNDPEKLGRVKVRVPHVYASIGLNDLPWALPAGMAAGNSAQSGGFSHLPEPGDQVFVRFLDGEPEKPIWEWGMQTMQGAKSLALHQYETSGKTVSKPKRSGWTRYGHTIELNRDGVIATSSQGYNISLSDGDAGLLNGLINVATPGGNMLEVDDETGSWTAYVTEDLYLNVTDSIVAQARSMNFTATQSVTVNIGTTLDVTAAGNITIESIEELRAVFSRFTMNAGTEPFVRGNQLVAFLDSLLIWLTSHIHGNGNNGSPTTPPIIPPLPTIAPPTATLVSTTIMGE